MQQLQGQTQLICAQRAQAQELRNQAQDLEIQHLRRQLEEEKAMREQLAREAAASSSAPQAPPQMQVPIPLQVPSSQDAQVHTSSAHQVQDVAAPAVGALRAPVQAAAAAASGFSSNFWSGLQGSHRLPSSATPPGGVGQSYDAAQVNLACSAPNPPSQAENLGLGQIWPQGSGMPQVPQVQGTQVPASPPGGVGPAAYAQVPHVQGTQVPASPPGGVGPAAYAQVPQVSGAGTQVPLAQVSGAQASAAPGGAPAASATPCAAATSGNPMMDALFAGMQQLQTMQAQGMRDKSVVSNAPEAVKPGTTALPMLKAPDPMSGSLDFQDWLELVAGLMGDLSDSSHDWWTAVLQASRDAYERWVKATPLDRIRVEVDERPELVEGKWSRVNARACTMILAALDQGVKAEMVARRTTQVATQIMFRLYTLYQPGGSTEKALVLNHLQNPSVVQDVVSGVAALRAWGRWHKRCIDCGMVAPDPTVLAGALTKMTNHILSQNPDPMFRTQMVRSMLHIETHPSEDAVQEYHKHLLAEFETMAGAQIAKKGGSGNNAALKAIDASGGKSGGKGGEAKGGGKGKPCKYFLTPKGCKFGAKCKAPHSMSDLPAAERFKKCLNCGSEEHRVKDCKAGKAEPKALEQKPSVQAASTSTSSSAPPVVQATPVLSMDSFLQHASHALRQLEAAHATHGQQPSQGPASTAPAPAAPTPDGGGAQQPSNPSLKRLTIRSLMPASCFPVSGPQTGSFPEPSEPPFIGHALLDSGATHPMRQASSEEEWEVAEEVQVSLAGDQSTFMRLTRAGTLLLPPGAANSSYGCHHRAVGVFIELVRWLLQALCSRW